MRREVVPVNETAKARLREIMALNEPGTMSHSIALILLDLIKTVEALEQRQKQRGEE